MVLETFSQTLCFHVLLLAQQFCQQKLSVVVLLEEHIQCQVQTNYDLQCRVVHMMCMHQFCTA